MLAEQELLDFFGVFPGFTDPREDRVGLHPLGPGDTADARAFRNLRQGIEDRLLGAALPVEQSALGLREA